MKKFEIPMIDKNFYIFVGTEEWGTFLVKCDEEHPTAVPTGESRQAPGKGCGRCVENIIWVEEIEWTVLFHELQHLKDGLFYHLDIESEMEFKACIASVVDTMVVEWVLNTLNKERKNEER